MSRRLLFNRDRCLACRSCELACAVAHSASGALLPAIDERPAPRRRVSIAAGPGGMAALRCAQCEEPLCAFACKSGALHRTHEVVIQFDEARCVGCLMCYMVCPWGIRQAGGASEAGGAAGVDGHERSVVRCDTCLSRETPACVSACPTRALGVDDGASGPDGRVSEPDVSRPKGRNLQVSDFSGHVVVVGSSAAGIAACEAAREFAPACRITLVTADAHSYSRPLLPYVLRGRIDAQQVAWRGQEYLQSLGVEVIQAMAVGVDAGQRRLTVRRSEGPKVRESEIAFDRLVIATGASATALQVPGADLAGVFQLRGIEDLEAIQRTIEAVGPKVRTSEGPKVAPLRVAVVGGGNVGLQAAEALARRGADVTVIVRSAHVLSQMLDEEAGRRVGAVLERNGVTVRTGRDVVEIAGGPPVPPVRAELVEARTPAPVRPELVEGRTDSHVRASTGSARTAVTRVRLDNGQWLEADIVIVGKGIEPNVEWVRSAGVRIGRGIVVDRAGRTSVEGIFAAGDCAEVEDPFTGHPIVSGIWPIAYEMGRAAGAEAVDVHRPAAGALRMNSSAFFGTSVISIGEVRAERVTGATEHVMIASADVYRKLVMKDGRVIGAVLYGDVSDAGLYYRMYRDGVALAGARPEDVERDRTGWIAALAEQTTRVTRR